MPFPEKKHQKANKDKTLKKHRKFYNIWCNTFYDQLHFIFISQAHSISHFFLIAFSQNNQLEVLKHKNFKNKTN